MALSKRGGSNVAILMPHVPPSLLVDKAPVPSPDDPIDLAMAENLSIREELLAFYKDTLQNQTIPEVSSPQF